MHEMNIQTSATLLTTNLFYVTQSKNLVAGGSSVARWID
jgi:hypothetical protein